MKKGLRQKTSKEGRAEKPESLPAAPNRAAKPIQPIRSLYIHVPFCAHKCEYCAFYSEPSRGATIQRYVDALIREMELVAPELRPETVFFGGGTPSLLTLGQWESILSAMARLNLIGAAEWTIECNPATVSVDKGKLWRSYGVNRISMGVQSLDEPLLERLGRIHTREMVFKSFDLLRQAGFSNVNLDLMFAIPGQTLQIWRDTLDEALALGSEHLSSYEVIYEEDTPLYAQLKAGQFSVNEELACSMYEELLERAASHGFAQYEVANFARASESGAGVPPATTGVSPALMDSRARRPDGRRDACPTRPVSGSACLDIPASACRHNINYWRGGPFHGLGPSAAGYVGGVRTKNWSNTTLYCERLEQGKRAIESAEQLPPLRRAGEIAAFGLRMNAGWPLAEFQEATGYDLRQEWASEIDQLVAQDWARLDPHRFHLTAQGLRFADAAAEMFLK